MSALRPELADAVGLALGASIAHATPVAGGDINRAHRLQLSDGRSVFLKTHPGAPPDFFAMEAYVLISITKEE